VPAGHSAPDDTGGPIGTHDRASTIRAVVCLHLDGVLQAAHASDGGVFQERQPPCTGRTGQPGVELCTPDDPEDIRITADDETAALEQEMGLVGLDGGDLAEVKP
jgi:hypothetical protein